MTEKERFIILKEQILSMHSTNSFSMDSLHRKMYEIELLINDLDDLLLI